jgi:hypothetical protein
MLLPAARRPATDATVDDSTGPVRTEVARGRAREEERPAQVDLLDVVPDIDRQRVQIAERDSGVPAGVVDEDVEPAELAHRRLHRRRDRGRVALIELHHRAASAALGDQPHRLEGALFVVDPRDGDVGAGVSQCHGDRAAEITRPAGNEGRGALEVHGPRLRQV